MFPDVSRSDIAMKVWTTASMGVARTFGVDDEAACACLEGMWRELAHQVKEFDYTKVRTGDDALRELASSAKPHPVVLFTEELWHNDRCTIHRKGDLLVGFALPSNERNVALKVCIGGDVTKVSVETLVEPGKLTYALEGVHCVPLINLAFHGVKVITEKSTQPPSGLRAVYALLDTDDRRALCIGGCTHGLVQKLGNQFMITKSGMVQELVDEVCTAKSRAHSLCTPLGEGMLVAPPLH